ncbi:polyprenol phosphomannose-dependent alpha 1,6 mannosyltransferase MptB [Actinomadura sp. ATCC 31491]|uniref:Polyprenol phosphomannose-dependent alpha 1,6 mannosyltransferase MptB n=1 Tax=Actinomadura luzonensis TaxID=2805427 RepID=A0ABT0FPX8_9ACTN|nr:polyprenol phosphomannose-dependent alpha 1,6 mannosyltransferase MptB [Actinomadura luzonensis]
MSSETRRRGIAGERRARAATAATAAIGVSALLTIVIGLLGPSPMVPALDGPAWQPPYSLAVHPDPHLAVALAAAAIVVGGLGLLAALILPDQAAAPDVRLLVKLGCLAAAVLAFLPPSGSGDHLNYAAYGRMLTLGLNPYTHGAADLAGDPIADAVERPWREEPSVYGPVATAVQAFASWVGGDSMRLTVFVLALVNAAAFVVTGLLLDRATRHDEAARRRAALLWTANPLLLYHLVAGLHADTLAVACMVAALLARGRPAGGGVLLGLGVAVKVNAGLVALGPAWELRRRPGRLAVMAGCALAVVAAGYAVAGPEAIAPVTRTSKSISHATVWKLVQGWLQVVVGPGKAYRGEIQVGSLLLLALLAWLLLRWAARGGWGDAIGSAPVVAAGLAVAYVFASPYVLPWYDGLAFGMLALVAASAVDGFLVVHLLVLSLAYLPARVDGQPADLAWLSGEVRPRTGWVLLVLTIALAVWAWRAAARGRRPRASAAPPPSAP